MGAIPREGRTWGQKALLWRQQPGEEGTVVTEPSVIPPSSWENEHFRHTGLFTCNPSLTLRLTGYLDTEGSGQSPAAPRKVGAQTWALSSSPVCLTPKVHQEPAVPQTLGHFQKPSHATWATARLHTETCCLSGWRSLPKMRVNCQHGTERPSNVFQQPVLPTQTTKTGHIPNCAICNVKTLVLWFSSVQSLSCVRLFATPWTAVCQASLSITNSQSLLKFMSIESVMPSNHLMLCRPLLFLPSIIPSIRVFSNQSVLHIRWPKY